MQTRWKKVVLPLLVLILTGCNSSSSGIASRPLRDSVLKGSDCSGRVALSLPRSSLKNSSHHLTGGPTAQSGLICTYSLHGSGESGLSRTSVRRLDQNAASNVASALYAVPTVKKGFKFNRGTACPSSSPTRSRIILKSGGRLEDIWLIYDFGCPMLVSQSAVADWAGSPDGALNFDAAVTAIDAAGQG